MLKYFTTIDHVVVVRLKTMFLFVLLFAPVMQLHAASLDTAIVRSLRERTIRGQELAYNFDFAGATKAFDQAIAAEPDYPRPYLGRAAMTFWNLALDRSDTTYDKFLGQADEVISHAERYMDKYGKSADLVTALGTVYGYRAFAHARMKNYLKAAWDGKKSYDAFNEALSIDRQWYDAYAGIGVYHYFSSFIPKTLQWVVGILGVQGDSERGIKELKLAMERGVYGRTEAKFFLAELLPWHSDNFEASESILRELTTAYPKNSLMSFTLAVWQLRRNDAASARTLLQKIEPPSVATISGLRPFILYKLAECHFRLRDYASARDTYRAFLGVYRDENYIATANYRLGLCLELLGGRDEAVRYYKAAAGASRKFGDDAYAARKAEQFAKHPVTGPDTLLLRAQALFKSGRYDAAVDAYNTLRAQPGLPAPIHAEAEYGLGEVRSEQKKYREALMQFEAVANLRLDVTTSWLAPWSHYQAGLCLARLNEKALAKKEFEKALQYNDYDFENWVSHRAKRELENLGAG